jgi:Transposase IS4
MAVLQFKTEMGKEMTEDNDVGMEQLPLDNFLACFPPHIIALTNKKLCEDDLLEMEMGELLKFFGVLIMWFEFNSQRDLWKPLPDKKFIPSPAIGTTTGMLKHQFTNLLASLTFTKQPETQPEGMSSEKYQWRLVDDFITGFNKHCHTCFCPSEMITIDKSMIRWYGIGGHWINAPNYMATNCKPDNGCESQNACC